MSTHREVSGHYGTGDLLSRLNAALAKDGLDPDHLSVGALAQYDQFHGRGLEATVEVADLVHVTASDHLLDIGSGIGGPARYFANRFGCRVTGIDLTPEFCDVARHFTQRLHLDDRITFEVGDALAMPFANRSFDGAYSMNVSMNIADKGAFYREILRVLKPGGWLVLSEVAKGEGAELDYPAPWARSASTSFLATPEETRRDLLEAGFDIVRLHSTLEETLAAGARARALAERGGKPPRRAAALMDREIAAQAMANSSRGFSEGRIIPIEVLARKPSQVSLGAEHDPA
ncbi:class I SAM-dependent methyltransferase [Acidovorax sp. sic0104]|uniref:class I SAM-dependent methyltransferase n=1 Tax=Acidovorax sp. sic0104 TaxID=2854784 RepID=UPI001C493592|nr:class I SAM-dependent methyltransferase [Acidovorax sp. sic0104]MBV7543689.1 class I SAM-dependent methyltransferase [Acidovorax sp. sic0104]